MGTRISVGSHGVGLGMVLFLLFLVLKLVEVGSVATWSWWWVFAPLWIPVGGALAIALVVSLSGIVATKGGKHE